MYTLQDLTLDRTQKRNNDEPLWEKKGQKLNKCLCKAYISDVTMVTVLLISEGDNEPKCLACVMMWFCQNCSYGATGLF